MCFAKFGKNVSNEKACLFNGHNPGASKDFVIFLAILIRLLFVLFLSVFPGLLVNQSLGRSTKPIGQ